MQNLTVSDRALNYPMSTIRGLTGLAVSAKERGVKVISLNLGAPDLATPPIVKEQGVKFLSETDTIGYGPSAGDPKLIESLVQFYRDRLDLPSVSAQNLLITQGASEALELVMYSVANEGDTILTPDPCYSNYGAIAYKYGIHLGPIPTQLDDGFHLMRPGESVEDATLRLSKLVTPKTKAIIWSSPCNPTGAIYSATELQVFLALSRKYNLFLIADEVYRLMSFTNSIDSPIPRAPSILDVATITDRSSLIVLDSASKMLSFCGGRVGVVIADPSIISNLTNQSSVRGCPSTISQAAVAGINSVPNEYFQASRAELLSRRDFLYQGLKKLRNLGIIVSSLPPEGAFYLVIDLGKGIIAADYCKWLLTDYLLTKDVKETVFFTPMRMGQGGFYLDQTTGFSQIRIAYVLEIPQLKRALNILAKSLPIYHNIRNNIL